ncbi:MAG: CoA transferase [Candidatus Rokubacteria bacterium]|nr:CoA transferase [Candidatus Rokubacteria bacterium]
MTSSVARDWSEWVRGRTAPAEAAAKPEALDHLRVLDLSRGHFGGLFCSSLLAEFGAEVIRLEPLEGDPARRFSPEGLTIEGTGLAYLVEGRNKLSATCALERAEGRALFGRLVGRVDVVIETCRPGQLDAWGVGYRQCSAEHPGLIWVALATHGQFGPRARQPIPDYDVTNQALSGVVFATGEMPSGEEPRPWEVPTKIGAWMGWYVAGAWAAFGALLALRHRRRTGRGQLVDVSGAEGLMRLCNYNLVWHAMYGKQLFRVGNVDLGIYPYGIVRTRDGYAFLAGFSDVNFRALCTIMERPELVTDPRFATFLDRAKLENMIPLKAEIETWSTRYTAAEILAKVQAYRGAGVVATAKANTPGEVLAEAHWWERGALRVVEDPVYGRLLLQASPLHMTETPPRIRWACRPVGADSEFVYGKYLGLGREALAELRDRGII